MTLRAPLAQVLFGVAIDVGCMSRLQKLFLSRSFRARDGAEGKKGQAFQLAPRINHLFLTARLREPLRGISMASQRLELVFFMHQRRTLKPTQCLR